MDKQVHPNMRGIKMLEPVMIGGRLYQPQRVIENKYYISDAELRKHRKTGLPSIKVVGHIYFNEDDFHRYFSGEIGDAIEKEEGKTT